MDTKPLLSCHLTYGFETLNATSAADLLEFILKIPLSKNDSADFDSMLFQYHAPSAKFGELESVLLFDNRAAEANCRESLFPECWFIADIVWKTTHILELGRLAAAIEACGDVRIKLIRYKVTWDWAENGNQQILRWEFRPENEESRWDSHFSQYDV